MAFGFGGKCDQMHEPAFLITGDTKQFYGICQSLPCQR
jgi:hypothetical protein